MSEKNDILSQAERGLELSLHIFDYSKQKGFGWLLSDEIQLIQAHQQLLHCLREPSEDDRKQRHDLRNRLGAIKGYSELLLEELDHTAKKAIGLELDEILDTSQNLLTPLCKPEINNSKKTFNSPMHHGRVMVVDDDKLNRDLLVRYLREKDHDVLKANSGKQALEILDLHEVDLIFLDLLMPEMNGLEVLQKLKKEDRWRHIPVIMISGIQDTDGVIQSIEQGADDYLFKPFNPILLQARLNAGLERKQWHDREKEYRRQLERNQAFIRHTFGRYVSDEVVNTLLEEPEGLDIGGAYKTVTVMMCDIRNFTRICDQLTPDRVVQLLNNYLSVMGDIIQSYQGTIDEFQGDGILALFGAPMTRDDDADRAICCAIAMQKAVPDVNRLNKQSGLPDIGIGIGLNTGQVVAGNIGSEKRTKYAVVGQAVNLTARIESLTEAGQVFASSNTIKNSELKLDIPKTFQNTPKGFTKPIAIHHIADIVE